MILGNQAEYGEHYPRMHFVTEPEARSAMAERADLFQAINGLAETTCRGTKLFTGELSPGCAACCAGQWSCLFINGICNGRCFYCPAPQISKSEPTTNSLRFAVPQDYLDYVATFQFQGVSISGGEPFMTFDRTLSYARQLKKRFGDAIHLWLYTNGILATEEKISLLRDAGLDEMRFDISADQYRLDKVKLAVSCIPRVTVEIPAIPEDYQLMRELLSPLADVGVRHLNLHQLRCTPHNLARLLDRNYTFGHGPRVLVLESELAALRLLLAASQENGPAVNYCSYAYKGRYQATAARKRAAQRLIASHEDITEAGYIRSLWLKGPDSTLSHCAGQLEKSGVAPDTWLLDKTGRLFINQQAWPHADLASLALQASYYVPQLREKVSYRGSYKEIRLNKRRAIVAERVQAIAAREIPASDREQFERLFIRREDVSIDNQAAGAASGEAFKDIYEYERIPAGLYEYA